VQVVAHRDALRRQRQDVERPGARQDRGDGGAGDVAQQAQPGDRGVGVAGRRSSTKKDGRRVRFSPRFRSNGDTARRRDSTGTTTSGSTAPGAVTC
jgi:hypothetical protein